MSMHHSTTGMCTLMITTLWFVKKFAPSVSAFLICRTHHQTKHTYRVASPYLLRKHSYTQIRCSPSAMKKSITAFLKCTQISAVRNQMWCCHLSKRPQLLQNDRGFSRTSLIKNRRHFFLTFLSVMCNWYFGFSSSSFCRAPGS